MTALPGAYRSGVAAGRLARSLQLVATSWFQDGRGGIQQAVELVAGYARWLADYGVLHSADAWRGATASDFVPDTARSTT
ncbi:MAG TPA: hypothetical protein VMK13_03990 [Streptosporangiaceae bacterium]|nr:hypothetical protein [Streptosporangiaceae bacterium]